MDDFGALGENAPNDGSLANFTLVVTPDPVNIGNELYELNIQYGSVNVTRNFGDFQNPGTAPNNGTGIYDPTDGIFFSPAVTKFGTLPEGAGVFDNFTVSIPEPSTLLLLSLGAIGLTALGRKRRSG